jgi:hypothetical protein
MVTSTATEQGRRMADLPPELFRHWIHSREEDQDGVQSFRTQGFAFPPSFGRDGTELRPDGTFVQDDIRPADGIVQTPGTGPSRGPGQVAVRFDGAREDYAFTIVSVEPGLRIRRAAGRQAVREQCPCADTAQMERFASAAPVGIQGSSD